MLFFLYLFSLIFGCPSPRYPSNCRHVLLWETLIACLNIVPCHSENRFREASLYVYIYRTSVGSPPSIYIFCKKPCHSENWHQNSLPTDAILTAYQQPIWVSQAERTIGSMLQSTLQRNLAQGLLLHLPCPNIHTYLDLHQILLALIATTS